MKLLSFGTFPMFPTQKKNPSRSFRQAWYTCLLFKRCDSALAIRLHGSQNPMVWTYFIPQRFGSNWCWIWMFPKNSGFSPQIHPWINRVFLGFPLFSPSLLGCFPIFGNTHFGTVIFLARSGWLQVDFFTRLLKLRLEGGPEIRLPHLLLVLGTGAQLKMYTPEN